MNTGVILGILIRVIATQHVVTDEFVGRKNTSLRQTHTYTHIQHYTNVLTDVIERPSEAHVAPVLVHAVHIHVRDVVHVRVVAGVQVITAPADCD